MDGLTHEILAFSRDLISLITVSKYWVLGFEFSIGIITFTTTDITVSPTEDWGITPQII